MRLSHIKYCFIALLCAFVVSGCASKPKLNIQPEKPLPSWYLNPPANTDTLLHGVGAGETLEQAKQAALSDLVAKLGISIESKFESVTESTNYSYSNRSVDQIKSEVAKIRISNYELVSSEQVKYNQYAALVQSQRSQFAKDLTQQLDDKIASAKHSVEIAKQDNPLKRYYVSKQAYTDVKSLEASIIVLSSMNVSFNNKYYQNEILKFQKHSEQARRNILFVIKADQKSNKSAAPIRNALSQQGFAVGNSAARDGVLTVNIKTASTHSHSMGFQIADMVINIRVTDHQGRLVGSNSVSVRGAATRGFAVAEEEAIKEFNEEISKQGISKLLGITEQ